MQEEENKLYTELVNKDDQITKLIGYNMNYLANNNYYQFKMDELEKEKSKLFIDNCRLHEDFKDLRKDYSDLLSKYKKLKGPPEIYKKRKSTDIVESYKFKRRRKNKSSLGYNEIKEIFENINSIQDIIDLREYGNKIHHDEKLVKLINIIPPLEKLNNMIGLDDIKSQIFDHILFFIQNLSYDEMYHTVISGPPGVGKTELGKILGSIYLGLDILKNDTFRIVKRSELVGKYLGHTAAQTQEIIDSCQGGVMFIDEAYSLGNEEKRDSFSKECLDTINQNLTENKGKFMCIIAGYKDSLNKCFFSYNEGLKRRFPFWYEIQGYSEKELKEIFVRKLKSKRWKIEESVDEKFFSPENFAFFGGDIENFIFMCKMAYSKRIFKNLEPDNKNLKKVDLDKAYTKFKESKDKLKIKHTPPPFGMYC